MNPPLLDAFDAIRVINLPRRTDRRAQVQRELAALGYPPGKGKVAFFDAIEPAEPAGFDSIGARGCFLSHLAVLTEARAAGWSRVLVVEDDAMFMPALLKAQALEALCRDGDWDFLYVGHVEPPVPGPLAWLRTTGPLRCTHGYAVRSRVLPALTDYLAACLARRPGDPAGGPMHVDGAFTMFRGFHPEVVTYRASTSLIIQRSSRSDVAAPRRADALLPAWLLGPLRAAKSWLRRHG